MSVREINKAMAAHGVWKIRLREAIESGASEYLPEIVAVDKVCEFGKWSIPYQLRKDQMRTGQRFSNSTCNFMYMQAGY